jgi:hypothetical protein
MPENAHNTAHCPSLLVSSIYANGPWMAVFCLAKCLKQPQKHGLYKDNLLGCAETCGAAPAIGLEESGLDSAG